MTNCIKCGNNKDVFITKTTMFTLTEYIRYIEANTELCIKCFIKQEQNPFEHSISNIKIIGV